MMAGDYSEAKTVKELIAYFEQATADDILNSGGKHYLPSVLAVGSVLSHIEDYGSQVLVLASVLAQVYASITVSGPSEWEKENHVELTLDDKMRILNSQIRILYPSLLKHLREITVLMSDEEEDPKVH